MARPSDKLTEYRQKRDFQATNEPTGAAEFAAPGALRFVVQKHDATRLHYDVRLEVDGVLKSWAVPEGPSTDPQVKRLAVETEDHPMEYLTFEGVIPKGQYGAGPIIVWDSGTYTNIRGDKRKPFSMQESYEQGLIEVRLSGEKLRGAYALVRTKFRDAENSWLMVKMKDSEADPERDLVSEFPQSIKSGKTIEELWEESERAAMPPALRDVPEALRPKLRAAPYPGWLAPMLATAADKPFERPNWLYEQKLDGQRCLVYRKGDQVQLISRNQLLITSQYPELVAALLEQGHGDFVLDAEIVAFDNGRPSFEMMQQRMHVQKPKKELLKEVPVFLYAFDVLYYEGYSTTALPQIERKHVLERMLEYRDPLRYTQHQTGGGLQLLAQACKEGLEGIIAKDANAAYQHRRSPLWLKFKCVRQQEMVVGGYTEGKAGMRGFGSLLVGYYPPGETKLQFAGGVGTGFSDGGIRDIAAQLDHLASDENPFAPDELLPKSGVHWVKPVLVAQVGYGEWTSANKMRHPRFLGLRNDIDPQQVTRETAGPEPEWADDEASPAKRGSLNTDTTRIVDGHKIKLTNLDKALYPDGITKGEVIDYYERVAPFILPHIQDRPLNLERFPNGIGTKGFYHKETPDYFPKYIDLVEVKVSDTETQMQSMANNAASLVYLAQMAALTLHHWLSRAQHLEHPDKIVFDLDPSTEDGWEVVRSGAADLRNMLAEMGLPSFLMATGSRGLHVAVPLQPEHEYEAITLFAKAVCRKLEREDSKFTTQFRKEKRKGRVFLDHLRNRYGHTSVAPYTLRAKPGAPVAAPLSWDELDNPDLTSQSFTIANIFSRLEQGGDPWKDFFKFKAPLPGFEMIQKVLG
ncbi:MAG: DNA ligase D [Anaerolineales bacterium]|nr:DNA ligase D [Anaerolineales bacterium]MCW5856355.1 DNA ligase D [Anaerolineales bacterium]